MMTPTTFSKHVDRLIDAGLALAEKERVSAVNDLIEKYVQDVGDVPPQKEVDRLTNFILDPALRSNNKRHNDRPIYTDEQLSRKAREGGIQVDVDECLDMTPDVLDSMDEYAKHVEATKPKNKTENRVHNAIHDAPTMSDREIARTLGLSQAIVSRYRKTYDRKRQHRSE